MWARSALVVALALVTVGCGSDPATVRASAPTTTVVPAPTVLPRIDAAMRARLRAVVAIGRQRGNREGVFAKVGDSITASHDFLVPIGCGDVEWGRWTSLMPVVPRWSTPVAKGWLDPGCPASTSFTRVGASAAPGWTSADLLRVRTGPDALCPPPDRNAVECELDELRPTVALVEIGSNDIVDPGGEHVVPGAVQAFEPRFRQLVETILAHGVVPIVSTIPPRHHPAEADALVGPINAVIRRVAAEEHVPLWDFWLALQAASQFGMAYDWVHPSPAPTGAGDLGDKAMDWGYNVRNLTALQVLDEVDRLVLDR